MIPILLLVLAGQQDPNVAFTAGTASAARGQAAYGTITVPARTDSGLTIPIAVIHGSKPGKVVAFVPHTASSWIAVGPQGADWSDDDGRTWTAIPGGGYHAFAFSPTATYIAAVPPAIELQI